MPDEEIKADAAKPEAEKPAAPPPAPVVPAAPEKPAAPLGRNGRPIISRHYAPLVLAVLMLWPLLGCTWLESVVDKLPPVQLCVTYKGRQFCAQKVNGVWKFEADLTADEQAEIVSGIEGGR